MSTTQRSVTSASNQPLLRNVPELIVNALRQILAHPKNPESFAHARRVLDYHDATPPPTGAQNTMSLEAVIEENTAVMRELIVRLAGGAVPAAARADSPKPAKAEEKKAEQPKVEAAATPATEKVDYEKHVKPAAIALAAKKNRDALLKVCAGFTNAEGNPCASAKEFKAEDYPAALKALTDAVAA